MISGLYTLPGFCDTAMAAACANLLLGPTMKRSNVYPSISGISSAEGRFSRYSSSSSSPASTTSSNGQENRS